jgi:hypothetical protein
MNLDFIQYRSYKNLDMENFIDDVRSIDFENLVSVENVDETLSKVLVKSAVNTSSVMEGGGSMVYTGHISTTFFLYNLFPQT